MKHTPSILCLDEKLSVSKTLECLQFLTDCGNCFEGIDVNEKKQNLSNLQTITVTYPENGAMLTGMKVMATAEIGHGTLVNKDIFLRCDYRVLKKDETDVVSIARDTLYRRRIWQLNEWITSVS